MRKAWIVARHEFQVTVKRVWFVLATFVLPLVTGTLAIGMQVLSAQAVEKSQQAMRDKPLGVIDLSHELGRETPAFRLLADEKTAKAALAAGEIGAYLVVPRDYVTNERATVNVVTMRRPTLLTAQRPPLPSGLHDWLLENLLRGVGKERLDRAKSPFPYRMTYLDSSMNPIDEKPEETVVRSVTAYIFFFLLFVSIFTSSSYLLQGMAEEKEHRVMEMVLSSVTPRELMMGKLAGLGGAGLLQMAIWVLIGLAVYSTGAIGSILAGARLHVAPQTFAFCFVYFILGYVLYGSLMLGFGALGTNLRESQQMASIWSILGISPMFIQLVLFEEPHGTIARVFSFIPFTAPTTMMFRYMVDPAGTPVLDIVCSIAVLVLSTVLALRLSARLYRAGLLLYGKRPGVREIWRWLVTAKE